MSYLSTEKFEHIINSHEGQTLDFKRQIYDFSNDRGKNIAKEKTGVSSFIKDIVSFTN